MRDKPERFRRPAQATMTDMRERRMRGPLAARYRSSPRAEAHSANLGSGTEADCTSTRTRPPATAPSQREAIDATMASSVMTWWATSRSPGQMRIVQEGFKKEDLLSIAA